MRTSPQTFARFMNLTRPCSSQVLVCDPNSITFPSPDKPNITSSETTHALHAASHHLRNLFQTVVFPTETVYGLGASALNSSAVAKIFATKGRPPDNPLIVHVSSFDMLKTLLPSDYTVPKTYHVLMKHFWPGPLTLLFPRNSEVIPSIITAGQSTVAIRMPSHPVARALIAVANIPLAAPSANTSGKPSPTRIEHVIQDLGGKVDIFIDGGQCGVGLESTVVDGLHEDGDIRVLRPGGITVEDIENALREELHSHAIPKVLVHRRDFQDEEMEQSPTTPGMKYRHYSPSVPITLLRKTPSPDYESSISLDNFLSSLGHSDAKPMKVGVMAPSDSPLWGDLLPKEGFNWHRFILGPIAEPAITAQRLFHGFLTLEQEGVNHILIEEISEEREGLAIMNRVKKAAGDTQWITPG